MSANSSSPTHVMSAARAELSPFGTKASVKIGTRSTGSYQGVSQALAPTIGLMHACDHLQDRKLADAKPFTQGQLVSNPGDSPCREVLSARLGAALLQSLS